MRTVRAQLSDASRELITWLVPPIAPAIAVGVIWTIVIGGIVGFNPTTDWIPIAFTLLAYVVAAYLRGQRLASLTTERGKHEQTDTS